MSVTRRGRGRPHGYKVSDETKERIKRSSLATKCVRVVTPDGEFDSLTSAGRYYNLTSSSIAHRCRTGERQRVDGYEPSSSVKDYRGWYANKVAVEQ